MHAVLLVNSACDVDGCSCGGGESSEDVGEFVDTCGQEEDTDEVDVWRLSQEDVRRTVADRPKSVVCLCLLMFDFSQFVQHVLCVRCQIIARGGGRVCVWRGEGVGLGGTRTEVRCMESGIPRSHQE